MGNRTKRNLKQKIAYAQATNELIVPWNDVLKRTSATQKSDRELPKQMNTRLYSCLVNLWLVTHRDGLDGLSTSELKHFLDFRNDANASTELNKYVSYGYLVCGRGKHDRRLRLYSLHPETEASVEQAIGISMDNFLSAMGVK